MHGEGRLDTGVDVKVFWVDRVDMLWDFFASFGMSYNLILSQRDKDLLIGISAPTGV